MNWAEGRRQRPHTPKTGQIETRRTLFDVGARVSSDTAVQFFKVFHKKPTGCVKCNPAGPTCEMLVSFILKHMVQCSRSGGQRSHLEMSAHRFGSLFEDCHYSGLFICLYYLLHLVLVAAVTTELLKGLISSSNRIMTEAAMI